jgi:hypothetical protein
VAGRDLGPGRRAAAAPALPSQSRLRRKVPPTQTDELKGEAGMADRRYGGISLGGIIVIVGIVLMFVWSFWIGLIVALIGLIAFGGFVRGRWY